MVIRNTIDKVADFADELDLLDYEINILTGMAGAIIENDVKNIDLIIETLPNNGIRPVVTPIYPAAQPLSPLAFLAAIEEEEKQKIPQPIGFHRIYNPQELGEEEGMITIQLEINQNMATAMIDTLLNRLKKRKAQIIRDTKQVMRIPKKLK